MMTRTIRVCNSRYSSLTRDELVEIAIVCFLLRKSGVATGVVVPNAQKTVSN
jgi:hypothetical protein